MTSTKNIPVLSKQPRAPYVLGSSLDSDDTGSTHWKPFKLEGIFFGGVGPTVNLLGWETTC